MTKSQAFSDKNYLLSRVGSISQIAGPRRYILADGAAAGVEAVDIRTGSGLEFTVLPGRGMDIAWASYKGLPLSFISQTGVTAPEYYNYEGLQWLRGFFGGLLTTCGLLNVGPPCEEEHPIMGLRKHSQHGRITHTKAENVCVTDDWADGSYVMSVSGRLREASLFGENLTLTRTVTAKLGENRFIFKDTVENHAPASSPFMLLYHINLGYPLLDEGSEIVCSSDVTPRDEAAAKYADEYTKMDGPTSGRPEEVFFHDVRADAEGISCVKLINRKLGIGAYLKYPKAELGCLTEWKNLGWGEYTLGLEPGNCYPVSQAQLRREGKLEFLQPGEKKVFNVEFGVLDEGEF